MLYRKAIEALNRWKKDENHKALCIIGARQVGKTTLIRHFAKEQYAHFAEVNFLTMPNAQGMFDGPLDADTLITNLTAFLQQPLVPGKTLVLFDEIQECPAARSAIKPLVEDGRFDYIESGSLLGVRSKTISSYPVGFEELHTMYPMDLEEFFIACGVQVDTLSYLKECYLNNHPVHDAIHQTLNRLFYVYLVVGGMPEAVNRYTTSHDIAQVIRFQRQILDLYRLDITKYSQRNTEKIRAIFDAMPSQLDDKNRRFMLSDISKSARQERFENSFLWLSDAGVALPCYNVTQPAIPLQLNEKHSLFKLYFSDTGLLCAACMSNIQYPLLQGDVSVNMGSILENAIAQQLRSNGFDLHYFHAPRYGEVDFIVQKGKEVIPIEVKSGSSFKTHKSLDNILSVPEWRINHAYVLGMGNLEKVKHITYLPWYMIMFIQPEAIPETLLHSVDLQSLQPPYV